MTPLRDVGNRVLLGLANTLFRTAHTDLCYGYAAFRREAFHGLELTADGFEIEAQLFLRAHRRRLRVVEVASFEAPRRFGNSNLNTFRDGWRVLRTILSERVPDRIRHLVTRARRSVPVTAPIVERLILEELIDVEARADARSATDESGSIPGVEPYRIPVQPRMARAWSGRERADRPSTRPAPRRRPEPVKEAR